MSLARQSFLALRRDRVLRVATWFPSMLDGLGRDRVCFWPYVATVALCCDRFWPGPDAAMLRQVFSLVATDLV